MRRRYDFSRAKRNPYARRLKQQLRIRLDRDTIRYFRHLAEETGIGYQTLINLYLRECASPSSYTLPQQRRLPIRPRRAKACGLP